jgi:hypothetical protein
LVNASLISGLSGAWGIAVSGSDLFVTNTTTGTIGEYTTSGVKVNASLISGLNKPEGIAIAGSDVFVVNNGSGAIGEYSTSGATINASLVSGLSEVGAICLSQTPPPLVLTTSAAPTSVDEGDDYPITWVGGSPGDMVQVWAEGGPTNSWTELTPGVAAGQGSFTWDTAGVAHGWYYFQVWFMPADGVSYSLDSPGWLHVVAPAAQAPNIALSNPPLATDQITQGSPYTLNWTASNGAGDNNPLFVQLWMYSGDTGQWTEVPGANNLAAGQGSFAIDTTALTAGWYSFSAHATNGDQWSYAASPGWLNITVPTPTITYLTPAGGQIASPGGWFNVVWDISGLPGSDVSSATVQIWAQYLNNGMPVWTEIAAGVNADSSSYNWAVPSSPGAGTYYAFNIYLNYGDEWWAQASPNWLEVT